MEGIDMDNRQNELNQTSTEVTTPSTTSTTAIEPVVTNNEASKKEKTDVLALLAFIFGIVGVVNNALYLVTISLSSSYSNIFGVLANVPFSVVALVFGTIRKRKLTPGTKMYKKAHAGFVLGIIGTALYAITLTIIAVIAFSLLSILFNL